MAAPEPMAAARERKGTMAVRKRGKKWYYDFMINHNRYVQVIPWARTQREALEAETKAKLEVYEGKFERRVVSVSLKEFFEQTFLPWSKTNKRSWRSDEWRGAELVKFFGNWRLNEISQLSIEKYKRQRLEGLTIRKTPRSPTSVNREIELLSRIFTFAIDMGFANSNPCKRVKKFSVRGERNRPLLPDEEARLMSFLTDDRAYLRPIVIIAIQTGLRKGELLSLKRTQVDFVRELIHVTNTKSGRDRFVPMNVVVRSELRKAAEASSADSEYLFANPTSGKPYVDIKKGFRSACDDAKIRDLRFHDLRHTFGTRLADSGASTRTIMDLMGHSQMATSARYTHATDHGKRRAVEALATYAETIATELRQKRKEPEPLRLASA